jgi:hypothetical protein
MCKFAIVAFGLVLACPSTGARAQASCNYVDIARAQDGINNMTQASQKDETMREVAMARRSMASGDQSGCMAHMQRLDDLSRQR